MREWACFGCKHHQATYYWHPIVQALLFIHSCRLNGKLVHPNNAYPRQCDRREQRDANEHFNLSKRETQVALEVVAPVTASIE